VNSLDSLENGTKIPFNHIKTTLHMMGFVYCCVALIVIVCCLTFAAAAAAAADDDVDDDVYLNCLNALFFRCVEINTLTLSLFLSLSCVPTTNAPPESERASVADCGIEKGKDYRVDTVRERERQ
jgi:hypothetical protein